MKRIFASLFFLCTMYGGLCIVSLHAAEVKTFGDFRFLGGQYFFNQAPSSLSGNFSFTVVPSVKVNDSLSIVPSYMGLYRGTKEVNDLVGGGGTLFQDSQDHLVSVKGIYTVMPPLKLKLGTSYRLEYLRETRDEMWGKGLFDYKKLNASFETEYSYLKNQSVRAGFDYYTLTFPNYESLESSVSASGLGRELAGKNVLDSVNQMMRVAFNNAVGPVKTEVGYLTTAKNYPDQPLVLADSSLSTSKRKDTYNIISANAGYPLTPIKGVRMVAALEGQLVTNDSTQAHYDARKTKYTADYYDYTYRVISPAFHFAVGSKPWALSAAGSINRQEYKERLVQDVDGNYLTDKVSVDETIISVSAAYPITPSFKLRITSNYIDSKSNMKYEKTFAYNYISSNYLMGFSYEF